MSVPPVGPVPARIMLVGEAPGEQEVLRREPFVGASGAELNRMLHEAGILRSECFITNVCRERPPDNDISAWMPKAKKDITPDMVSVRGRWVKPVIAEGVDLLMRELAMVQPNIIVAFGNTPLWALTGKIGIKNWRGSLLTTDGEPPVKVIPAYHPAYILRDWSARAITVQDLRRVKAEMDSAVVDPPEYSFVIRPDYAQTMEYLHALKARLDAGPLVLSVDIETRAGHIACLGIATDTKSAFCIPFMCVEREDGYWSEDEEVAVVGLLARVLCHPNSQVIGQNFIYDAQYIYRHWGIIPSFSRDTMLGHHACYSGLPKGLDFLSSMYCQKHIYWKDEGKTWDKNTGEEQLWTYNCKDCCITYEVDAAIQAQVDRLGLREQHDFQMSMWWPVLEAMIRGVRVDKERRSQFALDLSSEIAAREAWFKFILDHPLNPGSSPQMKRLFYEDLGQKAIFNRKTGQVTLDDEALQKIASREPLLRPLVRRISEYRSLGVFLSTFVGAKLDNDQRLRCSYNIAGTETYRLSSSKNAFDSGLNLQNIPKGGSTEEKDPHALQLPNVRTLFVPDPGYTFFDADLDRADLQVVVWEAGDEELMRALQMGVDLHCYNACDIYNIKGIPIEELIESHPNYPERRAAIGSERRAKAKGGVHAVDYGCKERTLAAALGISVHEADLFIKNWFARHPGIAEWHRRVEQALATKRFVQNAFGYRRYYFDRIEGLLPEALAWIPQSTVAVYINRIWRRIYDNVKDVQILLQVHDSLAGQFPTYKASWCRARMMEEARQVVVPYERPLIIPLSIKTSTESWGLCEAGT